MDILTLLGVILAAWIAYYIPSIVLAVVALKVLEYGPFAGLILILILILAILKDLDKL